jgi:hypothetical protein
MGFLRAELTAARRGGRPRRGRDVVEPARMLTVVMSGLISLQLANEPGVPLQRRPLKQPYRRSHRHVPHAIPSSSSRVLPLAGGATCPAVSARFEVVNQVPRHRPWKNPRGDGVRAAPPLRRQPDRAFAGTLVWSYEVEPDGEGTLLTESHRSGDPCAGSADSSSNGSSAGMTGAPTSAASRIPGRAQGDGRGPAPGPGR